MSYTSTSIARALDQINRSIFLPAIQRPYVWEPEQITALFDSLLKGYPISSFLFWEIEPDRRTDWEIYKFIENFRRGETHNETIEPDGREVTLVLDGQQRLTSLLIGLRGSYTTKRKYARNGSPDAWTRQRLYIDLLKAPNVEDEESDADLGITYGLRFAEHEPRSDADHLWFKLGNILDCTSDDAFDALTDRMADSLPPEATRAERRTAERNLERLYRIVWKDEVIAHYTEKDQSLDRVLDIFIRANDGGTKLSKSDLLLSMVTSKWTGVSARQEIFDLVDHLNDGLAARNSLSKDFVMKACLVLSDLDVTYKVNNFTNRNLAIIEEQWPRIKRTLEMTLRLVNSFGIDKETLSSANALMPIAYYLHNSGGGLDGSTPFEVRNAARIHRFLIGCLLNGAFSGTSDQAISASRNIIRDALSNEREFPLGELVAGLARRGRLATFNDDNVAGVTEVRYGQRQCFLALSLLYDSNNWGVTSHHIDHIIPRSLANRQALTTADIPQDRIDQVLECVDRLGNLELLLGRENLEKNSTPFDRWITTRDEGFIERHLIPNDRTLWAIERLPEFVREREHLIKERLRELTQKSSDQTDSAALTTA
ncbi:DUF262 domain-containing protein [Mesorhizobium sp.]|uniref:DUF262 domain-containing protein n=1 Tax=Mesorhizobium sp. TaxID=1871066 RepID=UPI000FE6223C|nr:DUF262 domain-containing protein [Mesorhizobium sp.]RWP78301.1 MAG: DUF262 domain-containing protein [Mesorhizobium sp.]